MRHSDLPERWQAKLKEYLLTKGSKYSTLSASDFPLNSVVRITFEDGSKVEFRYAFVIESSDLREVAVLTEHCGCHLFQLHEEMDLVVESGEVPNSST